MTPPAARDPRSEATAMLPSGYEARVLEPSPPANTDPDWLADDPTDPAGAADRVVTPIPGEGSTWADVSRRHADIEPFAAERWLIGTRPLREVPESYDQTRRSLHQVAYFAVAPKRYQATGKLGLRYTHNGFGTPFFGDDEQVRVEGVSLIWQRSGEVEHVALTTVAAACEFLGLDYQESWFDGFRDPLVPQDPEAPLRVDPECSLFIGDWFGYSTLFLERARRIEGAVDVSRVQLWPEHFDPAFEMGDGDRRASYGASPGDDDHPEPYLYVSAWGEIDRADPYWNDPNFNGSSMSYAEVLDSKDPVAAGIAFLREGWHRLAG